MRRTLLFRTGYSTLGRASCFLLSVFLMAANAFPQQLHCGRVLDSKTGEPLPYVNIRLSNRNGAISNIEGEFQIAANPNDTIIFSYVGYERLKLKASTLPKTIHMQPLQNLMSEVIIEGVDPAKVVKNVIGNLEKDYRLYKKQKSVYFYRSILESEGDSYLIEALLGACNSINIRSEVLIVNKRRGLGRRTKQDILEYFQYPPTCRNSPQNLQKHVLGENDQTH